MTTPSPALLHKIKKARASASSDLPLVRTCAQVVLTWLANDGGLDSALKQLKSDHGANWSLNTALQLLSGRRGQFAAEAGSIDERATLYFVHLVAKSACSEAGLSTVDKPTEAELVTLRRLSVEQAAVPLL